MADPLPRKPQFFNFDATALRVVGSSEAPQFIAKDVLAALGLGGDRVSESLSTLDDDEKGSGIIATLGGPQEMLTVNESGLYALIFRSRKPSAKIFRKWVTSEVLPAIRRTGAYQPRRFDALERDLAAAKERIAALVAPKALRSPPISSTQSLGHAGVLCAYALARQAPWRGTTAELLGFCVMHGNIFRWITQTPGQTLQRRRMGCTLALLAGRHIACASGPGLAIIDRCRRGESGAMHWSIRHLVLIGGAA